jgi:deoxycytidylate deaminase
MNKKAGFVLGLDRDEYWMGVALLLAARAPYGNACVIVESDNLVGVGMEGPPKFGHQSRMTVPAELDSMINCEAPYKHANLYLTTIPSLAGLQAVSASMRVQRLVYRPVKAFELDEAMADSIQIVKFDGNLNWLRDYARSLDNLDGRA